MDLILYGFAVLGFTGTAFLAYVGAVNVHIGNQIEASIDKEDELIGRPHILGQDGQLLSVAEYLGNEIAREMIDTVQDCANWHEVDYMELMQATIACMANVSHISVTIVDGDSGPGVAVSPVQE